VTIVVILAIHSSNGELPSAIAGRILELGGKLTGYRPDNDETPARAYFTFENEDERQRFVNRACGVPGVSLEPPTAAAQ
jgi:hypothetical protein